MSAISSISSEIRTVERKAFAAPRAVGRTQRFKACASSGSSSSTSQRLVLPARADRICVGGGVKACSSKTEGSSSRRIAALQAAAAGDVAEVANSSEGTTRYGYVIANAKFMLHDEEHLAELLRERRRLFLEQEREIDFWIVPEPAWIGSLPANVKVGRPSAAIVSTNLEWISFLKLRLDKCYRGEMDGEKADVLASSSYDEASLSSFEPPAGWDAPYPRYQKDWWKLFLNKE